MKGLESLVIKKSNFVMCMNYGGSLNMKMHGDGKMQVCVITDNVYMYEEFRNVVKEKIFANDAFSFFYSYNNDVFTDKYHQNDDIEPIKIMDKTASFWEKFDVVISLHCKQIFPLSLVERKRCINFHPGFNPYNRGCFPHIFSIINKLPTGVTVHEMDGKIDHGGIIIQKKVVVSDSDTSGDVYRKILKLETQIIKKYLRVIIDGNYEVKGTAEGNINTRKDFMDLCKINMDKKATYGEVIDYLRAMSFDGYDNAYFINDQGEKVYVKLLLNKEEMRGGV